MTIVKRHEITDSQWSRILPFIPAPKGRHGGDIRLFLNAVLWIAKQALLGETYLINLAIGVSFTKDFQLGLIKIISLVFFRLCKSLIWKKL